MRKMKKINDLFNYEQLNLLKKININICDGEYSDEEIFDFINKIEDYLVINGFVNQDKITKDGQIAEDILNILADL